MLQGIFGDQVFRLLERGLDVSALRQQVISDNLANVDTPRYKRSEVTFEDELAKALSNQGELTGRTTDPRHIPIGGVPWEQVQPRVSVQGDTSVRNDGNNVDIDKEMVRMSQNSIMFEALLTRENGKLSSLKSIIKEAR